VTPQARARLAYVALFCSIAAAAPYLVLYYQHVGFDVATIGAVVSVGSVVSLLAGPAWGLLSDRRRGSPLVLVATAVCGIAGVAGLSQAHDLATVLGGVSLLSAGFAGLGPIIDARALEASGPERSGYGPLRAWGSLAYVAASFGTGLAVDRWGIGAIFAVIAAFLVATAAIGSTLDRGTVHAMPSPLARASPAKALRLLVAGPLGLFLGGAWLTFTGFAALLAFYSLRFAELHAPATMIGLASAIGAAVEVPVMLTFPRLAARFGADRLVVVGAAVFTIREFGAALTSDPGVLVVLAGIGGVGYACFLVGGITYVSRHAPAELAATAQGLFSGLATGLAQVVAGMGGGAIAAMAGLTGLFATCGAVGIAGVGVVGLAIRDRVAPRPTLGADTELR
jgi:PPP family 3-phenylpropionic acid transporter